MENLVRQTGQQRELMQPQLDPFRLMRQLMNWEPFTGMFPSVSSESMGFTPRFEVKETKDAYVFKADLPGVKEENLDITLTGNRLAVSGHREAEQRVDGDTYYTYERSYGSFSRSFTLPEGVDADNVSADLKSGVLTVSIPKRPEHQPKKISLKSVGEKVKALFGGNKKDTDQA